MGMREYIVENECGCCGNECMKVRKKKVRKSPLGCDLGKVVEMKNAEGVEDG